MIFLPTVKQLQYLLALFEHRHFGKAADACFVTQSTLSAGLRELESALDVVLVERTKRVVRFTPLGERIARKAYRVLQEVTELAQMAHAAGTPLTDELRLGVIPTIAPFFLPRALPTLRRDYPRLRLFLREEMSGAVLDGLMRGQLDCGLIALPYPTGDCEIAPLFADRFHCAFHRDEFPGPPDAVLPAQVDNEHLLLLEDGHCLRDQSLAACERPELRADRAILGTSLHTLVQMVDNGLGLTLVPQMAIDAGILNGTQVLARPLASASALRTIALIWRKSSPREAEFRLLAAALKAAHHATAQPEHTSTEVRQPVPLSAI